MNNSEYLKKYVERHPENKMAWYLLGKEYDASGQEGKARYCYIEAGDVYEAFESSKMPEDLWRGYQAGLLRESKRREKQRERRRHAAMLMIFALLFLLPSAYAPGSVADPDNHPADKSDLTGQYVKGADFNKEHGKSKGLRFTAQEYTSTTQRYIAGFAPVSIHSDQNLWVLGMSREADYLIWSDQMDIVWGLEADHAQGRTILQSYDEDACDCEPPEISKRLQKQARQWIKEQETLVALSSAMKNYRETNGSWPDSLEQLTQPFPNNWLAGSNDVMEEQFVPILARLKQGTTRNGMTGQGAEVELNPGQHAKPFFAEPLEIIVDMKQHRLAVVSGEIMLRSYRVGLGGDKTPEGTFRISDKVMNPNGKSNGEFGSRGMQLSDTNYAIHGTNEPDSVGKDESLGCIRMLKEDVEELFDLVPAGTKVTIGKGILSSLESVPKDRFKLGHRQMQTNPRRTYHWLD